VKSLRAEHPSHDYLRRLPQTFSRDSDVAAFLRRYLAMFDGTLGDLEGRSEHRDALLEPRGTPSELLPWLASFLGLTLDERWPLAKRRALIAACTDLFRKRGTVAGLRRFLRLYLDVDPILIEQYRLRGRGSALVGGAASEGGTVVGASFRVGGEVAVADDSADTTADAFETHAHRFTVVITATLDERQLDVVRYILDVHRPAHTMVDVCTAGAGMRIGLGLHIGLLSTIGRTGSFASLQLGVTSIGHNAVLGRPEAGIVPESARLGKDTTVG
jgi:phage tail-like protein